MEKKEQKEEWNNWRAPQTVATQQQNGKLRTATTFNEIAKFKSRFHNFHTSLILSGMK